MKKSWMLTALALGICAAASAQTRTVAASGADHTTIADALAFFSPDPDGGVANVIQITDSGSYDEALTIAVPVTIEGTGASRPTILAQAAPVQATGDGSPDGLVIELAAPGTVTLRNLIIIPSATSTPTDDLIRTAGTDLVINMEDVLVTVNDGSGAPITTDGLAQEDMTGAIGNGDDGMFFTGTNTVATLTGVVVSHFQVGTGDGLVCSVASSSYTIGDGCVFSFNGRLGIQGNGTQTFKIEALTERVLVLGNLGFAGIWFAGAQSVERTIDGCNILNNGVLPALSWGIENQNRGTIDGNFSNMIIAGNTGPGIVVHTVGTGNTVLTNVTIADNGQQPIEVKATAAGNIVTSASIIAGDGSGVNQQFLHDGTGTLSVADSAVVTAGPFALTATASTGAGTSSITPSTTEDPRFVETVDFTSADFYEVSNLVYGTAGPAGAALTGGGTYDGVAVLESEGWHNYR